MALHTTILRNSSNFIYIYTNIHNTWNTPPKSTVVLKQASHYLSSPRFSKVLPWTSTARASMGRSFSSKMSFACRSSETLWKSCWYIVKKPQNQYLGLPRNVSLLENPLMATQIAINEFLVAKQDWATVIIGNQCRSLKIANHGDHPQVGTIPNSESFWIFGMIPQSDADLTVFWGHLRDLWR